MLAHSNVSRVITKPIYINPPLEGVYGARGPHLVSVKCILFPHLILTSHSEVCISEL